MGHEQTTDRKQRDGLFQERTDCILLKVSVNRCQPILWSIPPNIPVMLWITDCKNTNRFLLIPTKGSRKSSKQKQELHKKFLKVKTAANKQKYIREKKLNKNTGKKYFTATKCLRKRNVNNVKETCKNLSKK